MFQLKTENYAQVLVTFYITRTTYDGILYRTPQYIVCMTLLS